MTRPWILVMMVAIAGCTPRYYVSDVRSVGGHLVMTKCALGYRGEATHDCHEELVPAAPQVAISPR